MFSARAKSLIVLLFFVSVTAAVAQTEKPPSGLPSAPVPQQQQREISWKHLAPNVLGDQKQIWWAFPKELAHGKHWLPTSAVAAGTAGLIALDPHDEPYFRRTTTFHDFNKVMSFNGTIAAMFKNTERRL